MMAKFELGQVVATAGVAQLIEEKGVNPAPYLERYLSGDWGDVPKEDKKSNDIAVKEGERLIGSYEMGGQKVWIITEWDRSQTTLLFPSEY